MAPKNGNLDSFSSRTLVRTTWACHLPLIHGIIIVVIIHRLRLINEIINALQLALPLALFSFLLPYLGTRWANSIVAAWSIRIPNAVTLSKASFMHGTFIMFVGRLIGRVAVVLLLFWYFELVHPSATATLPNM